jgi:hypothetical protein
MGGCGAEPFHSVACGLVNSSSSPPGVLLRLHTTGELWPLAPPPDAALPRAGGNFRPLLLYVWGVRSSVRLFWLFHLL